MNTTNVTACARKGWRLVPDAARLHARIDDVEHRLDARHVVQADRHLPPVSGAICGKEIRFARGLGRDAQFAKAVVPQAIGRRRAFDPFKAFVVKDDARCAIGALEHRRVAERGWRRARSRANVLDPPLQARMRHVALEIRVPSPRYAGDGVQLDERADERLGVAGQRDCAEIAGGLVLLAIVYEDQECDQHDAGPRDAAERCEPGGELLQQRRE